MSPYIDCHRAEDGHGFAVICMDLNIFMFSIHQTDDSNVNIQFERQLPVSKSLTLPSKRKENLKEDTDEEGSNRKNESTIVCKVCSRFSYSGHLFAVATSSKFLLTFDVENNWILKDHLCIPKAPTAVDFDHQNNVLVSDKAGSLWLYKYKQGIELLGHSSMLLDFCFVKLNHIVSVDRDEKVKISRYPQTHVVENFCLGHSSFVSTICCLDEEIIATAGGDSVVRLWNIHSGKQIFCSPKIHHGPIKKVICMQPTRNKQIMTNSEFATLFVLPDEAKTVGLIKYDKKNCSANLEFIPSENEIFDIALFDQFVFAVGRGGIIYAGACMPSEFKVVNDQSKSFYDCLAKCVSKPLKNLYKSSLEHELKKSERYKRIKVI